MGLSIRAYAQHRGVSHTAVAKAIKAGRISVEPDGKIDPAKADAQWARNTLPSQNLNPGVSKPTPNVATRPVSTVSSAEAHAPLETRAAAPDYQTSRAIREAYAARLAKLEFEERTSKLISKAEVDVKFFQLARQLRDRLQQIPRKLAPEIVALVVADPDVRGVTDVLEVAIREALEDLSQ